MNNDLNEIIRCALADTPALLEYYDARTATAVVPIQHVKGANAHELAKQLGDGRDYVVKGLLSRRSYAVLYSDPGAGKSFVALDIAYHVAAGKPWRGHRVTQGPVIFLAFEGSGGLNKRAAALEKHYGSLAGVPLVIEPAAWNLRESSHRKAFAERVAAIMFEEFNDTRPALLVLDTYARANPGADENDAGEVGEFNKVVEALIQRTGACVLVLHHKNKSGGMRGSTALLAAVETQIEIDAGQLIPRKQRDVELSGALAFKLTPVVLGIDADGDAISSCIVELDTSTARGKFKPTGQTLDAWHALCNLAPNNEVVTKKEWAAAFTKTAWPVDPPAAGGQSKAFQRAVKALVKAGWVEETAEGWQRPLTGA